ncbi:histidinol phosphate phosphatase [Azotosporobacter soli]|uniref:histidinol phosphate phosphatase n=1 Tax=Azotosporobacter soli TaxID=3055040 RepID=UPI0031FE95D7
MLFDTHLHTTFSTDSRMTLAEAADAAEKKGIGIIVTEHMDIGYPEKNAFVFDVQEYFSQYEAKRSENMLLGIEIGMMLAQHQPAQTIIDEYPFDFVIGSIHFVDEQDIYQPSFYQEREKSETYGRYFESMAECIGRYRGIHTLGHIDYICRYAPYENKEIEYAAMREWIDPVLKKAAECELAMEINTRRLNSETVHSLLPVYRRFAELGGKMATIGSDSHRPEDVGRGLGDALALADAVGLQAVYFKNGKPIKMK